MTARAVCGEGKIRCGVDPFQSDLRICACNSVSTQINLGFSGANLNQGLAHREGGGHTCAAQAGHLDAPQIQLVTAKAKVCDGVQAISASDAGVIKEHIRARPACQGVVARTTRECVVARTSNELVGNIASGDSVIKVRALGIFNIIQSVSAAQRQEALGTVPAIGGRAGFQVDGDAAGVRAVECPVASCATI